MYFYGNYCFILDRVCNNCIIIIAFKLIAIKGMSRRVQYDDKVNKEDITKKLVNPSNNTNSIDHNNNFNPNMSSYSFKEDENDLIKSLPTHEYLQNTVVKALSDGMFEVSQAKPTNPIEFLGKYLLEQSRINKQQMKQFNKK